MNVLDDSDKSLSLDYHFSSDEIRVLARFFRNNQRNIPAGLEEFAAVVEKVIYNNMSIYEAEKFYS
jgi:hypothetical protein